MSRNEPLITLLLCSDIFHSGLWISTPEEAFAPDFSTVNTDEFGWHLASHSCGRGILGLWLNGVVPLMFLTWQ